MSDETALRKRVGELEQMLEALNRAAAENAKDGDPTELARRVIDEIQSQPYAIVYALAKQLIREYQHRLLLTARIAQLEAAQPRGLKALVAAVKLAISTRTVNHLAFVLHTYEAGAYDAGNSAGNSADPPSGAPPAK